MRLDFDGPNQCIEPYTVGSIDFPGMSILADTGIEELCVEDGAWIGWMDGFTAEEPPTYNIFLFDQPVSSFTFNLRATEHDEPIDFAYGDQVVEMFSAGIFSSGEIESPITEIHWKSGAIAYEVDWIEWNVVPEPSSALLLVFGLVLARWMRWSSS